MRSNYPHDQYGPPPYNELFQAQSVTNSLECNVSFPKPAFGPSPNDIDFQSANPPIYSNIDSETSSNNPLDSLSNQSSCCVRCRSSCCVVKLKYLKKILCKPTNQTEIRHRNTLFFWGFVLAIITIIITSIYGKLFDKYIFKIIIYFQPLFKL